MKDLVASQVAGYLAMTVTIVTIGLLGQFALELATGQKPVLVQSFLVYLIGVCLGMIVRSQTLKFYMKSIAQPKREPQKARERKTEELFESYWFSLLLTLLCGAIAGALVALLD